MQDNLNKSRIVLTLVGISLLLPELGPVKVDEIKIELEAEQTDEVLARSQETMMAACAALRTGEMPDFSKIVHKMDGNENELKAVRERLSLLEERLPTAVPPNGAEQIFNDQLQT